MTIEVTAGPDAGWTADLPPGRHLLGRAPHCDVVIDDPALEMNHLLLEIDDQGRVAVVQLAGRTSIAIDGTHFGSGVATAFVEVGDSRIDLIRSHNSDEPGLVLGVTTVGPLLGCGGSPVMLDTDALSIVDDHPGWVRGEAIVRSLRSQAIALGLTVPACVITTRDDPALDECPAVLEIGARWRARLTVGDDSVRLHAAGRSQVFMNSDARRSAILQPSSVRSKRSANSPTAWCSLGTIPNVTSESSERVPATISTVVVA
jgi:hypothetical protein